MSGKLSVVCSQSGLVKTGVDLYIDGENHHLKPQEEPYVFELVPGNHKLKFKDPAGIAKKVGGGVISGATAVGAGCIGLAAGLVSGKIGDVAKGTTGSASAGKNIGSNLSHKVFGQSGSIKGAYDLTMGENEIIRLVCTKDKHAGITVQVV